MKKAEGLSITCRFSSALCKGDNELRIDYESCEFSKLRIAEAVTAHSHVSSFAGFVNIRNSLPSKADPDDENIIRLLVISFPVFKCSFHFFPLLRNRESCDRSQ